MEKEEDDILRKYQHSFRNMKGKIHILEQQVPVEEQMRYFRASERWKKNAGGLLPAYDEECNHWFRKLTDQEEIKSVEEKKELLLNLANSKNPVSFRFLKQYVADGPDPEVANWAYLALMEIQIALESDYSEERQIYISTGMGGKGAKLRFYVLLVSAGRKSFESYQRQIIEREFTYAFSQAGWETETLHVSENYVELLLLIPIAGNIKKVMGDTIRECNEYGHFLSDSYTITNVKPLSEQEIQEILDKVEKTVRQAIKYGIVGVSNTLITALVIWVMMKGLHCSDVLSNVVGYIAGVVNSFIWNKQWTFQSQAGWVKSAVRFGLVFGICYFLQLGCLFLLNAWLPIDPYYNQLIAMAFYTVINFIFNKVYTFKE